MHISKIYENNTNTKTKIIKIFYLIIKNNFKEELKGESNWNCKTNR